MLAGLAAQSLTVNTAQTVWAFATVAMVFAALLIAASVTVATATTEVLRPIRMSGSTVKRWSGFVLLFVGAWFIVLATLPSPILGG